MVLNKVKAQYILTLAYQEDGRQQLAFQLSLGPSLPAPEAVAKKRVLPSGPCPTASEANQPSKKSTAANIFFPNLDCVTLRIELD